MRRLTTKQLANYCRKVDKRNPADCWEWTAYRDDAGYGHVKLNGTQHLAHRIAYFIATGKQPGKLCVLHSCDNPSCCNPKHLRLGTQADNVRDMIGRGRRYQHDSAGSKHGRAKLMEKEVLEILEQLRQPYRGQLTALGKKYGVSRTTINLIKVGKRWGHIHV